MKKVYQSTDLMRFIKTMNISTDGKIVTNILDEEPNYISRFFTPNLQVNKLSSNILDLLESEEIQEVNTDLSQDTVTKKILDSDLKLVNSYVYKLCQSVVLECFSLIYAIEERPELMQYIDEKDIQLTRENTKYVIDNLGSDNQYTSIVEDLTNMDIALGYIQKQLKMIQGGLPDYGTIS